MYLLVGKVVKELVLHLCINDTEHSLGTVPHIYIYMCVCVCACACACACVRVCV